MRALMVVVGLLALSACGGPRPMAPDEDVPATWTAGDDAPLEENDEGI